MGLFMDGDGIPLAFSINGGNVNEQVTLKPLKRRFYLILSFLSLSSALMLVLFEANRKFNDKDGRAFITTQSIKKLKKHLKEWALLLMVGSFPVVIKVMIFLNSMKIRIKIRFFTNSVGLKENGFEQNLL